MEHLIKGKRENGKWYIRPVTWAGVWNANHELVSGRTLFESDNESECDVYMMNKSSPEVEY